MIAPTNGHTSVRAQEDDRPIGMLFQDLSQDVRTLVALELALAKTEMSEKVSAAGKDVGYMAGGGFVIYAGFLAVIFAVIVGLSNLIPLWLSALIVGIVVILIGYALLRAGMNGLKQISFAPQQTMDSLQRDKEWLQEQRQ